MRAWWPAALVVGLVLGCGPGGPTAPAGKGTDSAAGSSSSSTATTAWTQPADCGELDEQQCADAHACEPLVASIEGDVNVCLDPPRFYGCRPADCTADACWLCWPGANYPRAWSEDCGCPPVGMWEPCEEQYDLPSYCECFDGSDCPADGEFCSYGTCSACVEPLDCDCQYTGCPPGDMCGDDGWCRGDGGTSTGTSTSTGG